MLPVFWLDLSTAARALLAVPPSRRAQLCRKLFARAAAADHLCKTTGRSHPKWGNGTLLGAAHSFPLASEPGLDTASYRSCIRMVLDALDSDSPV